MKQYVNVLSDPDLQPSSVLHWKSSITVNRSYQFKGKPWMHSGPSIPFGKPLTPREQSRIVRLLIERVGYDGRDVRVTVTFHSPGVNPTPA